MGIGEKTYEELLFENTKLRAELAEKLADSAAKTELHRASEEALHHQVARQGALNRYAAELAFLPYEEMYPFIISRIVEIFKASAAIITIYDEDSGELAVKYTSLTGTDRSKISNILGKKISGLRIPINDEQSQLVSAAPYTKLNSLHELTFGAIADPVGKLIEKALGLDWYIGMGLVFSSKLIGTIVMIGNTQQPPPISEEITAFSVITATTIGRKKAEEALIGSELQFRQLFDEAPLGYQSLDIEGRFVNVNKVWTNLFGYTSREVTGKWIGDLLTPASKEHFTEHFILFKEKGFTRCELDMIHKDGHLLCIEFEGRIGYEINGTFKQTHCILKDITAQRKAEQIAREREEIFEAIANYTANWETWFDTHGTILWTNPAALKYTGYTPDEILAMPDYFSFLVAEQDRERVTSVLRNALGGEDNSTVEFMCVRKDQSQFRISVSWNHIFDKEGKALGIRTSGHDITTHRQTEEAYTHSENLYRQMIDNAPFGMHFYDLSDDDRLIFTGANPAADKILGVKNAQFTGMPLEQAFPSLAGTDLVHYYQQAAKMNITWVTEQIEYADKRISGAFEVKAFQTIPGKMVAIFTDITKRKKVEEALHESQQIFEALTSVSPVGIFRTDINGETTFVNPRWSLLTGLSFKEAMDSKYLTAIHPDDRDDRIAEWKDAVRQGNEVVSEYRFLRPDGSIVWVQGHAVPEIVDNKIKGYIGSITDISDLKRAEDELLKAKEKAEASNRLKTTFMGNISHEIRTPLNGIIGFSELISSGTNTPEENKECVEFLSQSINRLTKIIDNIMDVSMMMSGNTSINNETFVLDDVVNGICKKFELQADRKNINFSIRNPGNLNNKPIISDKSLITRILTELIDNAIKFTSRGSVNLQYQLIDSALTLRVSDSGIGISHEFLPFVFEPFVQEDVYSARVNNSNGLGLSIVHEAVNILGGKVVAESTPGTGTSIYVTLPVTEAFGGPVNGVESIQPQSSLSQPIIMIVEDEEINMIYLKRLLQLKGYKLLFATNGAEAIRLVEEGAHIDLILMDMKMPGVDGFEATRRIKTLSPEIKITAVTAYASEADRMLCKDAGCDEYIAKPFQKNELYQLLKRMNFQP